MPAAKSSTIMRLFWDSNTVPLIAGTVASGMLVSLVFEKPDLAAIAFVALVPWLVGTQGHRCSAHVLSGLAMGSLAGAMSGSWLFDSFRSLGSGGGAAVAGMTLTCVLVGGAPMAVVGSAVAGARYFGPFVVAIVLASALLVVDGLRSAGVAGIPWLCLGHSQWQNDGVRQLAVAGGVPTISALVAGVNGLGALLLDRGLARDLRIRIAVAAVLGLAGCTVCTRPVVEAVRVERRSAQPTRILAIQPNIPAEERWNSSLQESVLSRLASQTKKALLQQAKAPDLVIYPETSLTAPLDQSPSILQKLERLSGLAGAPLLVGVVRSSRSERKDRYRNSAVWIDPKAGAIDYFDKARAVPLVESGTAFFGSAFLQRVSGQSIERSLVEEREEARSLSQQASVLVLFCYEAIFSDLVSIRREPGTILIANLVNDSWFAGSEVSGYQISFALFRAIESRLPMLRVAHGGVSAFISPYGDIVATTDPGSAATLNVEVRASAPPTVWEPGLAFFPLVAGAAVGWYVGGLVARRER